MSPTHGCTQSQQKLPTEPMSLCTKLAVRLTVQSLLLPGRPHITGDQSLHLESWLWQQVGRCQSNRW